jgi:hypothetical protein
MAPYFIADQRLPSSQRYRYNPLARTGLGRNHIAIAP